MNDIIRNPNPRWYQTFWESLKCLGRIFADYSRDMANERIISRLKSPKKIHFRCVIMASIIVLFAFVTVHFFKAVSDKITFMSELRSVTGMSGDIIEELKIQRAVCETERHHTNTDCVIRFVVVDQKVRP